MLERARALSETLVALRREFHRHPELGFQEHQTANLIANRLAELGIPFRSGVALTGLAGEIGQGGPCIALRADMDALPLQEENTVDYASEAPGVMHACGHDFHMACLLGAAQLLAEEAASGALPGQVRLLFQPSEESQDEEGLSGGMRLVKEGVMRGVDAVLALHVWSEFPVGTISVREGPTTAYPDKFRLVVKGQEAHGAFPHRGVDAIVLASQVINALQMVISRRLDPTCGRVLTVGTIEGGTTDNIMAGKVVMTGTLRSFEPETRDVLLSELERACEVARALGGDYELTVTPGYIPTVNDPGMTSLVREVTRDLIGEQNLREAPLEMGGEDFSYLAREAPGCFFWLGGATPGEPERRHHHPRFDADERCLPIGAAVLAEASLRFLEGARGR
jgi:amidohydrolase